MYAALFRLRLRILYKLIDLTEALGLTPISFLLIRRVFKLIQRSTKHLGTPTRVYKALFTNHGLRRVWGYLRNKQYQCTCTLCGCLFESPYSGAYVCPDCMIDKGAE